MMQPAGHETCPCGQLNPRGQPLTLAACCGRYLSRAQTAPDAQSLMRSRYSAFVCGDRDYLLETWHASTRPTDLALEHGVKWLGLAVREHQELDADHAEVAFVARSRVAGRGQRLEERSRFVREHGRWWYVDGDLK